MSIVITTDVFCDGDGCVNWANGVTGSKPRSDEARRQVEVVDHWVRLKVGGKVKDLCLSCQEALGVGNWAEGVMPPNPGHYMAADWAKIVDERRAKAKAGGAR